MVTCTPGATNHFFDRKTVMTISSPLRMSAIHWFIGSRKTFHPKVNFSSRISTRPQVRWPSTVHPMAVRHPFQSPSWCSPHDGKIGLLVCASLVRAPEGTFGAAVAEGAVADLLKVSNQVVFRYINFSLWSLFSSSTNSPEVRHRSRGNIWLY